MDENESKLSKVDCAMLLAFAIAIDSLGALLTMLVVGLVANRIVGILAFLTLFLWLKIKGIGSVSVLIAFFFELIPLVDALPFWTAAITRVIIKYGPSKTLAQVAEVASVVKKPTSKTTATAAGSGATEGAAATVAQAEATRSARLERASSSRAGVSERSQEQFFARRRNGLRGSK